ncbi:hypothetical protein MIMGU_mgv1a024485mg [Erythranthe guttata]|uniref:HMA domain-containing protein n=1 Tax=Erythranthe guttata TaxID=4155 RepID=A0A022QLD3_ERYGU|nr:hypothetical protein MIMGU_mgv1a024485mg [Erythranthe guttata]
MAQQKVVMKVLTMTNEKTRQKAIEAASDILGLDSITADLSDQKLIVVGEMDTTALMKNLKKKIAGKIEALTIGPT